MGDAWGYACTLHFGGKRGITYKLVNDLCNSYSTRGIYNIDLILLSDTVQL